MSELAMVVSIARPGPTIIVQTSVAGTRPIIAIQASMASTRPIVVQATVTGARPIVVQTPLARSGSAIIVQTSMAGIRPIIIVVVRSIGVAPIHIKAALHLAKRRGLIAGQWRQERAIRAQAVQRDIRVGGEAQLRRRMTRGEIVTRPRRGHAGMPRPRPAMAAMIPGLRAQVRM